MQVVIGALVSQGRVLLGRRSPDKAAYPDVWDLPGGGVEAGETELGALARELHEELGVKVTTASVSELCRLVTVGADQPVSLTAWLVAEWQGHPTNLAPDEHAEIRWFALDQLPTLAHESVREALVGLDVDR